MCDQIIYVDGVFDMFHEGHVNFLRVAAGYGKLIVGVHSDSFVESYKRKPVMSENSRYAVIEACRYVYQVLKGVGTLSAEMIAVNKINMVIHGDDFTSDDVRRHYQAALDREIFKYVPYTKNISSTKIITELEKRYELNTIPRKI